MVMPPIPPQHSIVRGGDIYSMMLSVFIWFVLPLLLIIMFNALSDLDWISEGIRSAATTTLVAIIAIVLIIIPIGRLDVSSNIRGLEVVRESINLARENNGINSIELAALSTKILEYNQRLGEVQYYANFPSFRIFFPESLYSVEPIQ